MNFMAYKKKETEENEKILVFSRDIDFKQLDLIKKEEYYSMDSPSIANKFNRKSKNLSVKIELGENETSLRSSGRMRSPTKMRSSRKSMLFREKKLETDENIPKKWKLIDLVANFTNARRFITKLKKFSLLKFILLK